MKKLYILVVGVGMVGVFSCENNHEKNKTALLPKYFWLKTDSLGKDSIKCSAYIHSFFRTNYNLSDISYLVLETFEDSTFNKKISEKECTLYKSHSNSDYEYSGWVFFIDDSLNTNFCYKISFPEHWHMCKITNMKIGIRGVFKGGKLQKFCDLDSYSVNGKKYSYYKNDSGIILE